MRAEDDETPEAPQLPIPIPAKIFERHFESRTILLHGEISSKLAQEITAQLLALAAAGDEPITMFCTARAGTWRPATRFTT